MKTWIRLIGLMVALLVAYTSFVVFIGFEGFLGNSIHFGRVALAAAVLVLYLPLIGTIFKEIPAPRRDYLIAGIILSWVSALLFAIGNEAGRLLGINMSIFINPVAGFFSLLLVVGGVFHVMAPGSLVGKTQILVAVAVGLVMALLVVVGSPYFR